MGNSGLIPVLILMGFGAFLSMRIDTTGAVLYEREICPVLTGCKKTQGEAVFRVLADTQTVVAKISEPERNISMIVALLDCVVLDESNWRCADGFFGSIYRSDKLWQTDQRIVIHPPAPITDRILGFLTDL